MQILSVFSPEFAPYGNVLEGYNTRQLIDTLAAMPLPAEGAEYVPRDEALEGLDIFTQLQHSAYGGLPVQLGWCSGRGVSLNGMEYHPCNEVNIGAEDFILLLARRQDMQNGRLDVSRIAAFHAPAGAVVELYSHTLHYTPCGAGREKGFHVAVLLAQGVNTPLAENAAPGALLRQKGKWLFTQENAPEAAGGVPVCIIGDCAAIVRQVAAYALPVSAL